MKNLKVTYRRKVFETQLPETWNEMTGEQFMAAVEIWNGGVDKDRFLCRMFSLPKNIVLLMDDFLKYTLLEQTEWMRKLDKPCSRFFVETLPGSEYESPGMRLQDVTLEQFMLADNYFQRYAINPGNEELLSVFIAALYHAPEAEDDDMQKKVKFCNGMDKTVRIAVFFNFILVRKWLSLAYPFLFPTDEESDEAEIRQRNPRPTDWLAIFDAFLGDDVAFIERYKRMLALDAFRLMNRRIRNSRIKH